jgi:hypothetical protein
MRAIAAMALAVTLGLAACAPAATTAPSTAPSTALSVAPSEPTPVVPTGPAGSQSAIVLRQAPSIGEFGCDAIGAEPTFHSLTFRIDPAAAEQVTALTDTGVTFTTYWSASFQPGTGAERVIRDRAGQVVVFDGKVIQLPKADNPQLNGYPVSVCNGSNTLYVFDEPDPGG